MKLLGYFRNNVKSKELSFSFKLRVIHWSIYWQTFFSFYLLMIQIIIRMGSMNWWVHFKISKLSIRAPLYYFFNLAFISKLITAIYTQMQSVYKI